MKKYLPCREEMFFDEVIIVNKVNKVIELLNLWYTSMLGGF